MKNINDILQTADAEAEALIKEAAEKLSDHIGPYQARFNDGITGNIYLTFGEFLYNALGKKINSQPKNKILASYWKDHKKDLEAEMKTSKRTLMQVLTDRAYRNNRWESSNRKDYTITHAVVSKGFAVGYVTQKGRVHSITVPAAHIFFYLTQEHVDLISNKKKRACAQDFLNFRDNFLKILNDLKNDCQIHELNAEAKFLELNEIEVDSKLRRRGYYNTSNTASTYLAVDKVTNGKVNLAEVIINDSEVRGRMKEGKLLFNTSSRSLRDTLNRHINENSEHTIDINLYNWVENTKEIVYHGSVCLGDKQTVLPVDIKKIRDSGDLCSHGPRLNSYTFLSDQPVGVAKKPKSIRSAKVYTLNWDSILNNKALSKAIDQQVKFFETASKTLFHLKKKHAGLVFIFGEF